MELAQEIQYLRDKLRWSTENFGADDELTQLILKSLRFYAYCIFCELKGV